MQFQFGRDIPGSNFSTYPLYNGLDFNVMLATLLISFQLRRMDSYVHSHCSLDKFILRFYFCQTDHVARQDQLIPP